MVTKAQFEELLESREGRHLSLYMPIHRSSAEGEQDRTLLKNLLQQAARSLTGEDLIGNDASRILAPAIKLLDVPILWHANGDGFGLFLAPGFFRTIQLSGSCSEKVVVGRRFHVLPLLPEISDGGQFFVLALDENHVRSFRGDRYRLVEFEPPGLAESLAEVMKLDDPQKELQYHATAKGGWPMFHGNAGGSDDMERQVQRFCEVVDQGLHPLLRETTAPLVLAATVDLAAEYRKVTHYGHVWPHVIEGSPKMLTTETLYGKATELLGAYFFSGFGNALDRYHELAGTGQTSLDAAEICAAAWQGRVADLIVEPSACVMGMMDDATGSARLSDEGENLVNVAAIYAFKNRAGVFSAPPSGLPDLGPLAATFRY
jgi:hypothetical protein